MTINLLGALATAFIICAVTGPSFISVLHKLNFWAKHTRMRPERTHEKKRHAYYGRHYDAAGNSGCRCRMVQFYTCVVHLRCF